ncbi:hypothetical protein [uncultured Jannaschia sp.]|uniref:hypothetical protein n=1 Tax=uncultured Jannaschia sp. TaxID=293347 RepID=UPI002620C1EF|nr:hypothetical protein [uncultured Jannaschia sp.]
MKITRIFRLTGVEHTREIDLTPAQLAAWDGGELIQDAAPHLSDADREFVMTGITAEEWTAVFGDSYAETVTIH